jgi:hypothetical protein
MLIPPFDRHLNDGNLGHRGATPSESGGSRNACFRRTSALSKIGGGEGVSQLSLKDKAFSTFLDQNPPF